MTQLEDYLMGKTAEVTGTTDMPLGAPSYADTNTSLTKTIKKVGEVLEQAEPISGEQIQKEPQAKPLQRRVDVTAEEMPTVATQKEAQYYALPSFRRYPLDNYAQVKQASVYFNENYKHLEPVLRREYCENLTKRASMLGIGLDETIRKYGAAGYADPTSIDVDLVMRRGVVKEASQLLALSELSQRRALMPPSDFAVALGEFDKEASIDHLYGVDIRDPYYTTYGEKNAEDDGPILVGNDYISSDELRRFARTDAGKLTSAFGAEFVKEFRKDPLSITRSLPYDQKRMVVRLASSTLTDPTTT